MPGSVSGRHPAGALRQNWSMTVYPRKTPLSINGASQVSITESRPDSRFHGSEHVPPQVAGVRSSDRRPFADIGCARGHSDESGPFEHAGSDFCRLTVVNEVASRLLSTKV